MLCLQLPLYSSDKTNIRSIDIVGNKTFSGNRILDVMLLKQGKEFFIYQLTKDLSSISELYHHNGYYLTDVLVDSLIYSDDSSFVDIDIKVNERTQLDVSSIDFEGNTVFSKDDIMKEFETRIDKIFYPQILEVDIDNLLSRYEQIGYPFAKISLDDIVLVNDNGNSTLQLKISIDEGPIVYIDEIRVTGNSETKENVIVREIRIKQREIFNQGKFDKIQGRLNRLNIFSSVDKPELYFQTGKGGILISVHEGNTNTFDGIVGYAPGSKSGEKGVVTGLASVYMRNLFGTGRKLHVRWQKDERYSQEIFIKYLEPWLFNYPINLGGSFFQRKQDTTYVKRILETIADILVTESFSVGGLLNHENVIPSSVISRQTVLNSRTISVGLQIIYDSRNDILSPSDGIYYRSDYKIGSKKIYDLRENNLWTVQKMSLDCDMYYQIFTRQVTMLGLHGRQLTSGKTEIADLFQFGGTNTLRGYRENQFLGSRIAWTNIEYRFILARRSYIFGFFDTGYYFLPGNDDNGVSSTQKFKYGYGIGIRLETVLGNMGVSFAFGEGDSFLEGKIHVGLMNEF